MTDTAFKIHVVGGDAINPVIDPVPVMPMAGVLGGCCGGCHACLSITQIWGTPLDEFFWQL